MRCFAFAVLPFLEPRSHELWIPNAGEMRMRPSQNWFSIWRSSDAWNRSNLDDSKRFFLSPQPHQFSPYGCKLSLSLDASLKAKNYCFNTETKIDFHKSFEWRKLWWKFRKAQNLRLNTSMMDQIIALKLESSSLNVQLANKQFGQRLSSTTWKTLWRWHSHVRQLRKKLKLFT